MSSAAPDEALTAALVAELAKKTGVCWLAYDRWNRRETEHVPHAAWHVWLEDEDGEALPRRPQPDRSDPDDRGSWSAVKHLPP